MISKNNKIKVTFIKFSWQIELKNENENEKSQFY